MFPTKPLILLSEEYPQLDNIWFYTCPRLNYSDRVHVEMWRKPVIKLNKEMSCEFHFSLAVKEIPRSSVPFFIIYLSSLSLPVCLSITRELFLIFNSAHNTTIGWGFLSRRKVVVVRLFIIHISKAAQHVSDSGWCK